MKAQDLKRGSIVEIRINESPEKINVPKTVTISKSTDHYIWFSYNSLQRISRNTFQWHIDNMDWKILSI